MESIRDLLLDNEGDCIAVSISNIAKSLQIIAESYKTQEQKRTQKKRKIEDLEKELELLKTIIGAKTDVVVCGRYGCTKIQLNEKWIKCNDNCCGGESVCNHCINRGFNKGGCLCEEKKNE